MSDEDSMHDVDVMSSEQVFDGKVFDVFRDRVRMPNTREVTVDVVRHVRSVVLLPVPQPGHVILIRQYRYAINRWLWELPAGSVDDGEEPEAAAKRECHEEIGQVPETIVRLGSLFPTPGYCDEEMIFFRLSSLSEPTNAAELDEDEDIEPRTFTIAEAREMIRRGEIVDMKTVAGLTYL
ncbi:MAG TPA: NUDIX hydrolase [Vicinamibacterales bacterium]|nr:NUDIX hydrolase [Vicinamibacterales bacterium]